MRSATTWEVLSATIHIDSIRGEGATPMSMTILTVW